MRRFDIVIGLLCAALLGTIIFGRTTLRTTSGSSNYSETPTQSPIVHKPDTTGNQNVSTSTNSNTTLTKPPETVEDNTASIAGLCLGMSRGIVEKRGTLIESGRQWLFTSHTGENATLDFSADNDTVVQITYPTRKLTVMRVSTRFRNHWILSLGEGSEFNGCKIRNLRSPDLTWPGFSTVSASRRALNRILSTKT